MFIQFEKSVYFVGESVPVEIIYTNTTSHPLVLEQNPAKSLDTSMNLIDSLSGEKRNYTMGKVIVNEFGDDQYAMVIPTKKDFIIEPESQYLFKTDIHERIQITPGRFECYLDENEKRESNHVEITFKYTEDSVDKLLEYASCPKEEYGRREWAIDLLKEIDPSFNLELPLPDDSQSAKEKKEKSNSVVAALFMQWWKESKESEEVKRTLIKINLRAGIEPF